jgi:hypothetical protein
MAGVNSQLHRGGVESGAVSLRAVDGVDELYPIEGHDAAAVVVSGVSPAEAYLSAVEAEQPSVGDGDAVSVAGQVLQHVFWSAEGRPGIDNHSLLRKVETRE